MTHAGELFPRREIASNTVRGADLLGCTVIVVPVLVLPVVLIRAEALVIVLVLAPFWIVFGYTVLRWASHRGLPRIRLFASKAFVWPGDEVAITLRAEGETSLVQGYEVLLRSRTQPRDEAESRVEVDHPLFAWASARCELSQSFRVPVAKEAPPDPLSWYLVVKIIETPPSNLHAASPREVEFAFHSR